MACIGAGAVPLRACAASYPALSTADGWNEPACAVRGNAHARHVASLAGAARRRARSSTPCLPGETFTLGNSLQLTTEPPARLLHHVRGGHRRGAGAHAVVGRPAARAAARGARRAPAVISRKGLCMLRKRTHHHLPDFKIGGGPDLERGYPAEAVPPALVMWI